MSVGSLLCDTVTAAPSRRTGEIVARDKVDRTVLGLVVHVVARVACQLLNKAISHRAPFPETRQQSGLLLLIAPEQLAMRTGRFVMVGIGGRHQQGGRARRMIGERITSHSEYCLSILFHVNLYSKILTPTVPTSRASGGTHGVLCLPSRVPLQPTRTSAMSMTRNE